MSLAGLYDVPAPAKINLFLHVVGRRADGYHLLQSMFVLVDWCDTLHFERRSDGRLQRHDLGPALPADDLSLRAARALQQASGTTLGADLSVMEADTQRMRASPKGVKPYVMTNLRTLEGLQTVISFIETKGMLRAPVHA